MSFSSPALDCYSLDVSSIDDHLFGPFMHEMVHFDIDSMQGYTEWSSIG